MNLLEVISDYRLCAVASRLMKPEQIAISTSIKVIARLFTCFRSFLVKT
jgi:hypothetical protein